MVLYYPTGKCHCSKHSLISVNCPHTLTAKALEATHLFTVSQVLCFFENNSWDCSMCIPFIGHTGLGYSGF